MVEQLRFVTLDLGNTFYSSLWCLLVKRNTNWSETSWDDSVQTGLSDCKAPTEPTTTAQLPSHHPCQTVDPVQTSYCSPYSSVLLSVWVWLLCRRRGNRVHIRRWGGAEDKTDPNNSTESNQKLHTTTNQVQEQHLSFQTANELCQEAVFSRCPVRTDHRWRLPVWEMSCRIYWWWTKLSR